MINVSQTIKNSCKADKNTHTEYVVINNQIVYIKGKLSATAYKDTTFFGTFNMKVLQFETTNTIRFRNRQFEYYKVIDGNAFKIGTFITTEVVDNDSKETVRVTANDFALKFAVPYTTSLNYNSGEITLLDVLEECCTNAGVTLENETLDNGDFIVDSNQFLNGEMIGDVICAIAGISGNFATITEQDKLKLLFATNTDEILEDYTNLDDKRDTQPITSVSIGMSQIEGVEAILRDETLIEEYGEHWLTINDNPFAYTLQKRQQLITAIFNKVKGFGYSSFKSEYTYRPYLTLGDKIKFKNKAGQLVDSIILRYEFDNEKCTFEAPSITSASVNYELSQSAEETAKRAEIIANQATASITSVTSSIQDIKGIVLGNYALTGDETFQANKTYYYLTNDGNYEEYTNYSVGDTIPANTIYELTGSIVERVDDNSDLQDQINNNSNNIQSLRQETNSQFTQTVNSFEASFNTITQTISNNQDSTNQKFDDIKNYLRYEEINGVGVVTLGTSGSEIVLRQRNDRVYFEQNGQEVAYISNNQLYITDAQFLNSIRIGNFAFIPRSNGSLGFRKVS